MVEVARIESFDDLFSRCGISKETDRKLYRKRLSKLGITEQGIKNLIQTTGLIIDSAEELEALISPTEEKRGEHDRVLKKVSEIMSEEAA